MRPGNTHHMKIANSFFPFVADKRKREKGKNRCQTQGEKEKGGNDQLETAVPTSRR